MSDATNRSIGIDRDAIGNTIVSGDGNIVIYAASREQKFIDEPSAETPIGPNPYMGLSAFHEEDADRFFGREKQTAELWEKLRDLQSPPSDGPSTRLLAIMGPSGSGKSSVARAGLIAELAKRPLPAMRDVRMPILTPGVHPLERLAGVLARIATGDSTPVAKTREFRQELALANSDGDYDGLRRIADELADIDTKPLVVLVDQFEEIYSLCKDNDQRKTFIENLLHAAADPGRHVTVVITLRTDFLGETRQQLNDLICRDRHHQMIPMMTDADLRAAIAKPAENAGHPLDEATVELLIKDTKDHEGALPLMQFALKKIWDGLAVGIEPAETYRTIGGVGGALAGEAQRIYEQFCETEQRAARRVFLGLVQLGEGTRDTRRRATMESLVSVGADAELVQRVIQRFAERDARLITLSSDEHGGADSAEVTHEALFDHWDSLKDWVDENREDIRFSRRLDAEGRHWDELGRPEGSLWRSPDLDLLREYHGRVGNEMNPLQMDFFIASDLADKSRVRKEQRQRRFLASALAVALAMLVLASISLYLRSITERIAQEQSIDSQINSIFFAPPATAGEFIDDLDEFAATESLHQYAVQQTLARMNKSAAPDASADELIQLESNKANLGVASLRLGAVEHVWPMLISDNGDPTLRSYSCGPD